MLEYKDINWILKIIRESCNLRGIDLEQAVVTIQKLQTVLMTLKPNKENENEEE